MCFVTKKRRKGNQTLTNETKTASTKDLVMISSKMLTRKHHKQKTPHRPTIIRMKDLTTIFPKRRKTNNPHKTRHKKRLSKSNSTPNKNQSGIQGIKTKKKRSRTSQTSRMFRAVSSMPIRPPRVRLRTPRLRGKRKTSTMRTQKRRSVRRSRTSLLL